MSFFWTFSHLIRFVFFKYYFVRCQHSCSDRNQCPGRLTTCTRNLSDSRRLSRITRLEINLETRIPTEIVKRFNDNKKPANLTRGKLWRTETRWKCEKLIIYIFLPMVCFSWKLAFSAQYPTKYPKNELSNVFQRRFNNHNSILLLTVFTFAGKLIPIMFRIRHVIYVHKFSVF